MNFSAVKDSADINRALFLVTHGLYILTSVWDGKINGQCLDSLMQVTNMPPRIAIGVGKRSLTHELVEASGLFVANVIDKNDPHCFEKVRHFGMQSGRKVDKFSSTPYVPSETGSPILPEAKAFYECRVVKELVLDLGTHTLFVADVLRAGARQDGDPLTYNEYRKVTKKGG